MQYVDSGKNCKLLLVGDPAQLPPVHLEISPALDDQYLNRAFNKEAIECILEEVVRQQSDSGILLNATALRYQMEDQSASNFQFDLTGNIVLTNAPISTTNK